jgi:hypothetical protein
MPKLDLSEYVHLEITDIKPYTQEMEDRQNLLKGRVMARKPITQEEKDELDMLEFFENAARHKNTNPELAVANLRRGMWEKDH